MRATRSRWCCWRSSVVWIAADSSSVRRRRRDEALARFCCWLIQSHNEVRVVPETSPSDANEEDGPIAVWHTLPLPLLTVFPPFTLLLVCVFRQEIFQREAIQMRLRTKMTPKAVVTDKSSGPGVGRSISSSSSSSPPLILAPVVLPSPFKSKVKKWRIESIEIKPRTKRVTQMRGRFRFLIAVFSFYFKENTERPTRQNK